MKNNNPLTFDELRKANVERCEKHFNHNLYQWSPLEWGGAAAGEMGELCNLLKKMKRGEHIEIEDVSHEIADCVVYLDLLSAALGIDLGEAVRTKFNIVSDRKNSKIKL
jgi:NTP pyrophosphatase (non-canonical NTP hydrolase)